MRLDLGALSVLNATGRNLKITGPSKPKVVDGNPEQWKAAPECAEAVLIRLPHLQVRGGSLGGSDSELFGHPTLRASSCLARNTKRPKRKPRLQFRSLSQPLEPPPFRPDSTSRTPSFEEPKNTNNSGKGYRRTPNNDSQNAGPCRGHEYGQAKNIPALGSQARQLALTPH